MKKTLQWISLYSDDIKGVIKVLALLILVLGSYKFLPIMLERAATNKLKGETIGVVIQKRTIEKIYESEAGGKLGIKGYEISYQYSVEGREIKNNVYLDKLRYRTKGRIKLFQLQVGDSVSVKYDFDTPSKSTIVFN